MKDDYVSVEHLLLALLEKDNACRETGEQFRVTHAKVMETLKSVRGNQRITSPEPEATFNALEKYSRNLTDMAQKGKLDPVIGRDEEIRRVIQILSRRTRTIPCSSAIPAWEKPLSWKGSRFASCAEMCRKASRTALWCRLTWGHSSRAPSFARIRGAPQSGAQRGYRSAGKGYSLHR